MCGIVGFWSSAWGGRVDSVSGRMVEKLAHRGPDDTGSWSDSESGLALAHQRLSILDLSEAGHQPMVSPCTRYVIAYNGEIYNHRDLRAELEIEGGHFDWRGHSDTETLLAALRHWGIEEALNRLNGMFAFALWDRAEQRLFLARDRVGEKPLYYGRSEKTFLFGSELKALTVHPDWRGEVDRDALTLYMRYRYVPAPRSIYRGIAKLPPAHYVVVTEGGRTVSAPQCYWNLEDSAVRGAAAEEVERETGVDELDALLRDAVRRRMVADVPLGAFLSGGYDSSTVAALMQAQSARPVKTFAIGFHERGYNEAFHAKRVAEHLGTDHTELYITPEQSVSVVPKLSRIFDEPFADCSQIPTFLVSQLARQHVKVSLSGDGGDELFCGYNRHIAGPAIWDRVSRYPRWVRTGVGASLNLVARMNPDRLGSILLTGKQPPNLSEKLEKLASALNAKDGMSFYRDLVSDWKTPRDLVRGGTELPTLLDQAEAVSDLGLREKMMYLDMLTYLPGDVLTKVDRASMAVSLEARVPFLDHRVVEYAWRLPTTVKYRHGQSKWLLRQVLYRYVPQSLMDRPKMGFSVPLDSWLRGPLRAWAEELLNSQRLAREGFLNLQPVRNAWREHLSGRHNHGQRLWVVLMFQAWLEEWGAS